MLKLSLGENTKDSINHGLVHLEKAVRDNSISDYKHAILSLFQATELILKELLAIKDIIYVFDKNSLFDKCVNPLEPTLEELYNCKSIEVNKLCKEILRLYPDYFNRRNIKIVEQMAKERNKIQHFSWAGNKNEIKNMILRLYHDIISQSLRILSDEIEYRDMDNNFHENLQEIFKLVEIANNEESILSIGEKNFTRMYCYKCGEYSLFEIFNEDGSYPKKVYCTSCNFSRENIKGEEYIECPDCGYNSLLYDSTLDGGICLNNDCDNNKEGGLLVDMEECEVCHEYKIDGICKCNNEN